MKEIDNIEFVKQLQENQKIILKEIDRVCSKNNLRYCFAFGSCLGAVRHKGFIPWDDDIDIYMPVEDFIKLEECSRDFSDNFFFQTHKTDKEYGLMIGRVRNSDTALIEKTETDRNINHGIFVDIYPLFNAPESDFSFKKLVFVSMLYRLMLYARVPQNRGKVMKIGSFLLLKCIPESLRKSIIEKFEKKLYDQKESEFLSSLYGDEASVRYPKDWFFPAQKVVFDDIYVPIPCNADGYLKLTYGDYMKLPPLEKQKIHHDFEFVDLHNSYKKYEGIYFNKESK